MSMNDFSHIDNNGKPVMVDVSAKKISQRAATAQSIVLLPGEVLNKLINGDIQTKKGAVFQTAIIAGIMAAKKNLELIPHCNPLGLDNCSIALPVTTKNV